MPLSLPDHFGSDKSMPLSLPDHFGSDKSMPLSLPDHFGSDKSMPLSLPDHFGSDKSMPLSLPDPSVVTNRRRNKPPAGSQTSSCHNLCRRAAKTVGRSRGVSDGIRLLPQTAWDNPQNFYPFMRLNQTALKIV